MRIGSVGVGRAVVQAGARAVAWRNSPPPATRTVPWPRRPAVPARPVLLSPTGSSFEDRVAGIAGRLKMRPGDLMAIMRFESGLRPDAINPVSHAVGLIQFLPRTAADLLGLPMTSDREAQAVCTFAAMSAEQQLDYVDAYLTQVLAGHGAPGLRDAYMAVFYPAAIGQGDAYVIARADSQSPFGRAVYRQNAGLDANGDGVITAGEAALRVGGLRG